MTNRKIIALEAPKDAECKSWITPGKRYEIVEWDGNDVKLPAAIMDNNSDSCWVSLTDSFDLCRADWIVHYEEPAVPERLVEWAEKFAATKQQIEITRNKLAPLTRQGEDSVWRPAQAAVEQFDYILQDLSKLDALTKPADPLEEEIREQLGDKFKHLAPMVAEEYRKGRAEIEFAQETSNTSLQKS